MHDGLAQWFSTSGPWTHFEEGHRTFQEIARFIEKFCLICVTIQLISHFCVCIVVLTVAPGPLESFLLLKLFEIN